MADRIPVKAIFDGGGNTTALGEFEAGDTLGVGFGGTGATSAAGARANIGAADAATVAAQGATLSAHVGDNSIHFPINDAGSDSAEVWSSFKTSAELSGKSDNGHIHDDRYYTKPEVDALIAGSGDAFTVGVSANDTTPGFLVDKLTAGQGQFFGVGNAGGDEHLSINSEVYIAAIGGYSHAVYADATKGGKTLTVNTANFLWSEAALSNNDWIQIGTANDADTGHVMPFDGTIVGATLHCEDDAGNAKPINLYINGSNNGSIIGTTGGGENILVDNSVNIDVAAGDKIRLRAGQGGGTINDTVITLYIKWRV